MSYINVTKLVAQPVNEFLLDKVLSGPQNSLQTHLVQRGVHLVICPLALVANAIDTVAGIVLGIGAICTLGKHPALLKASLNHLCNSANLVARPYVNLVRAINPQAVFDEDDESRSSCIADWRDSLHSYFIANVGEYKNSENFLEKHVTLRLAYGVLAVATLATRAVEGIFSIPVATVAILAAGKLTRANNLAYKTLSSPRMIEEFVVYSIKCINPWVKADLEQPEVLL